jgi:hypothetical protein
VTHSLTLAELTAQLRHLRARDWLRFFRPGDVLVLVLLSALTTFASTHLTGYGAGKIDRAVIRSEGRVVAEIALAVHKRIEVAGPLGITVVDVEPGRARIAADPGTRQLCVRQGWLTRANAVALCLPNRVTLQVLASEGRHDSLAY